MPDTTTRFFRGSCPVFNVGQTIKVNYADHDPKSISMTCDFDSECTLKTCQVKAAILSTLE
jgi:hypothetical protein